MDFSEWAWLPSELLTLILDRLFYTSDYIRFSAVCKPWHSVALDEKQSRLQLCNKQLPMLLVPTKDNSQEERSLYCTVRDKIYDQFRLRVPYNKRCVGSSYGWIATVEENMVINLINPFSGDTIRLPPVCEVPIIPNPDEKFPFKPEFWIKKVILSSNPSVDDDDYKVVVVFGGYSSLAFFNSGNKCWSYLEEEEMKGSSCSLISDVIYYKGQLHAVQSRGGSVSIKFSEGNGAFQWGPAVPMPADEFCDLGWCSKAYLVESSVGDLLMVQKFLDEDSDNGEDEEDDDLQPVTSTFKVFKMVVDAQGHAKWVEIESLDDDATLFLGDNHSTCISALNYPGCQSNSIYFTDDNFDPWYYEPHGPHDMGIFDLEDECIYAHYELDPAQKHMPPAVWIFPTFNLSSLG